MKKSIIIRVDDIGKDDGISSRLLDIFTGHLIPIFCQVVPRWLTDEYILKLQNWLKDVFPLAVINQHGYSHSKHNPAGERSYEFGNTRNMDQQYVDIKKGKMILQTNFPGYFIPLFTPPHDRLNQDTVIALEQLGFSGVLGTTTTFSHLDMPVKLQKISCFDCSVKKEGKRVISDTDQILNMIKNSPYHFFGLTVHAKEFLNIEQMEKTALMLKELNTVNTRIIPGTDWLPAGTTS
jgi:hypothetical protein